MKKILFAPLKASVLNLNVVELISEAILSGKIKPGQRLNETELAEQFQVSRTPIREALYQLQEQGLVQWRPRRGMFVVSLAEEDVQKINSLRVVLEAEALDLCRACPTVQGQKRLLQLIERMEDMDPEPPSHVVRLDLEFHRTLWSLTGNQYLQDVLNRITTPLFAHAVITKFNSEKMRVVLDSHRPLLEYVQGKRTESAEEMIVTHLRLRWEDFRRYSGRLTASESNRPSEIPDPAGSGLAGVTLGG